MNKIDLSFQAITPMFMYGADGKTLEFRIPSVKGMMRYWYRAINANNCLEQLKTKEALLLGGTDNKLNKKIGKSRINLFLSEKTTPQTSYQPLYYKKERDEKEWDKNKRETKKNGYSPGSSFKIRISSLDAEYNEKGKNIIELASVLGGFGQRSRRGYGSIQLLDGNSIKNYDLGSILEIINKINPGLYTYNKSNKSIKIDNNKISNQDYPYIKKIQLSGLISKGLDEILQDIIFYAHSNNSDYTGFVKGRRKLASPVYVSVIKDDDGHRIIVTRLNTVELHGTDKSQDFIDALMSIKDDKKKEQ